MDAPRYSVAGHGGGVPGMSGPTLRATAILRIDLAKEFYDERHR
jgi:hypothetical protein